MADTIFKVESTWHYYDRATGAEYIFDTWEEAKLMAQKLELAKALIAQAQALAPVMDAAPDVVQEYFDASITFTDADVEALGVTAAQVVALITLLENVNKFFSGGSPTNAQYRVNINAVRRAAK